eukprot:TRINITY_DN646_c0_g1_i3.p1 TRINITY_DN646_c0_g1~~TRINITY_DN646_c0_g1_i3.p1  ORF type:complete len:309 (+),score=101.69 TRINITY_DN646_c0_g1_i3:84-929(+)
MCIRDRYQRRVHGELISNVTMASKRTEGSDRPSSRLDQVAEVYTHAQYVEGRRNPRYLSPTFRSQVFGEWSTQRQQTEEDDRGENMRQMQVSSSMQQIGRRFRSRPEDHKIFAGPNFASHERKQSYANGNEVLTERQEFINGSPESSHNKVLASDRKRVVTAHKEREKSYELQQLRALRELESYEKEKRQREREELKREYERVSLEVERRKREQIASKRGNLDYLQRVQQRREQEVAEEVRSAKAEHTTQIASYKMTLDRQKREHEENLTKEREIQKEIEK